MANRRDRRKQQRAERQRLKKSATRPREGSGPYFVRSPFDGIPHDQLKSAALATAQKAKARLPERMRQVEIASKACDPIYFLGAMTRAVLTASVQKGGRIESYKHSGWEKAVKHFHIEWAQALFLSQTEAPDNPADAFSPQAIIALTDALHDLGEDYNFSRLAYVEEVPENLRPFALLQERIRLHTLVVRNWAFYDSAIATIQDLYGPLSDEMRAVAGFDAIDACSLFDFILRRIERTLNESYQGLRAVVAADSKSQMLSTYGEKFGLPADRLPAIGSEWSRRDILGMLLTHNDLVLGIHLCFRAEDVSEALEIPLETARSLLSHFSLSARSNEMPEIERIFLANPVWHKPILQFGSDEYLCAMPQLFFDNSFVILGNILKSNKKYSAKLDRRRAQYLEDRIQEIFMRAYPSSQCVAGAKWQLDGRTYETDLLVKVDSHLFIVEAKAAAITEPALRGAPDRVRRHIHDLIVAPSLQSSRLEQALRVGGANFIAPEGMDFSRVTEITRLSVTLEDFATIQSNIFDLWEAEAITQEVANSLTMSISDLECIFEILDNNIESMHYLIRRKEIQKTTKYRGDELDLLGMYLENGLNLGEIEKGEIVLQLVDMSDKIDQFFQAKADGLVREKPKRNFTPWFLAIRDQISQSRPARWTEAATGLMRISLDDQKMFGDKFEILRKKLNKSSAHQNEQDAIMISPPEWSGWGFAAIALRDPTDPKRHNKIQNVAQDLFNEPHVTRCLILCRPVGANAPAYSTLVLLDRPSAG